MHSNIERARKLIQKNQHLFVALEELDRTGKLPKLHYKERADFTIDSKLLAAFRDYCLKNRFKMSSELERMIGDRLKEAGKK